MSLDDPRPIDWAILITDLLVLAVIAVEYGSKIRRDLLVRKRVKQLHAALANGQMLVSTVTPNNHPEQVDSWATQVDKWITETSASLQEYSPQAVASFNHGLSMEIASRHSHIAGGAWLHYENLLKRLENLQSIMEKPDVYY